MAALLANVSFALKSDRNLEFSLLIRTLTAL